MQKMPVSRHMPSRISQPYPAKSTSAIKNGSGRFNSSLPDRRRDGGSRVSVGQEVISAEDDKRLHVKLDILLFLGKLSIGPLKEFTP
jgi:hypothetical protein